MFKFGGSGIDSEKSSLDSGMPTPEGCENAAAYQRCVSGIPAGLDDKEYDGHLRACASKHCGQ